MTYPIDILIANSYERGHPCVHVTVDVKRKLDIILSTLIF